MGLSVPSFCNFFKKTTQITFSDFVNQYRIQKSCMLLHQDKSISEVCFECGFNNVTYFNRLFKQVMNETPSGFKKENKPV
ncbi:helix-turn-helix domain-containing protein [Niabella hibiscisoli]|uniref:helix-turn-helix domain-containing protein n=1 Tax=Niabella hibiscisoli TaxID=1825928 RepID=UPI00374DDB3D